MGALFELSRRVIEEVERGRSPIDQVRVKGELATKAGFLVSMVGPTDPDDAARIAALREAAQEVLGIHV